MKPLHELLRALDSSIACHAVPNVNITGIEEDSRRIRPGNLFLARAGGTADGRRFAAEALQRGAAAMICSKTDGKLSLPADLPRLELDDMAGVTSRLAHLFYDDPTRQVKLLAVTGTNGKTTSTYLIRHLLNTAARRCGMIGTVEIDDGRTISPAAMTTPDPVDTVRMLARMRDHGCDACAIEASSHALHQERLAGARVSAAAFTNLTGDHQDYHGSMQAYAAAKAKLFEMLADDGPAVVNAADPYSARMVRRCAGRVIRFGFEADADYRARDILVAAKGSRFTLITPDGEANVRMSLVGRHNIENALTAAAVVGETFGLSVHQLAAGLGTAAGAPGRLQAVDRGQPFGVLVDYAHTDDALKNVLTTLRPLCRRGKLRVLFGCGGNRDAGKRPRMARVAQALADVVYITSDNPRKEAPEDIIRQILRGIAEDGAAAVVVEADRRAAIRRILGDAEPGDIVLLAGKGHENYQIIGTEKQHFDDVEEAAKALGGSVAAGPA